MMYMCKSTLPGNITIIFIFVILSKLSCQVMGEVFTAIVDLEPLLQTHERIIDDLDSYLSKEESRLTALKRRLLHYKEEHRKAMEDIPNYLGNPIHAFTLIKRLTTDLDKIELEINKGTDYIKNVTMSQPGVKYPTPEDLSGAAQALVRLQNTYQLDVTQLAQGWINGVRYSTPLSASDSFELARALYNSKDYEHALLWMKETLRKYNEGDTDETFGEVDILEYIAFSYYQIGDVESALQWTRSLLSVEPEHKRALGNIPHYERIIADKEKAMRRKGETGEEFDEPVVPAEQSSGGMPWTSVERGRYEALCRGDMELPPRLTKDLYCWYSSENGPFLRLAPFKVEQLYRDPDVFLYHDVMTDREIEHIMDMARPRFQRAVVHNSMTGELEPAHYRISKSAWLQDGDSSLVAAVSRRSTDITGLSMDTAEELQVVNYGIGGHYEPHFDFARNQETKVGFMMSRGNRIATVLFYMSDVNQGGATVFTELGLAVWPKKGAALVWRNLHASLEGDFATRHAACPVLTGSKWVSNKWIHSGGQEFLAPCSLDYQPEGIVRPLPKPRLKMDHR